MSTSEENLQLLSVRRNSTKPTMFEGVTSTFSSPKETSQAATQSGRLASMWAPSSFRASLMISPLQRVRVPVRRIFRASCMMP